MRRARWVLVRPCKVSVGRIQSGAQPSLSPSVLPEHALGMYRSVLRLYLAGVIVPLSCILISAFL